MLKALLENQIGGEEHEIPFVVLTLCEQSDGLSQRGGSQRWQFTTALKDAPRLPSQPRRQSSNLAHLTHPKQWSCWKVGLSRGTVANPGLTASRRPSSTRRLHLSSRTCIHAASGRLKGANKVSDTHRFGSRNAPGSVKLVRVFRLLPHLNCSKNVRIRCSLSR